MKRTEYTIDLEPEEIVINGTVYTVNVLMARDLEMLWDEGQEKSGMALAKRSIHVNGGPIGDDLDSLPMPILTILTDAVTRVNQDNKGNG